MLYISKIVYMYVCLFRIFDKSKNYVDWDIVELNRRRCQAAKGSVKCAISRAQEAESKKFGEKLDRGDKKGNGLEWPDIEIL